MFGSVLLTANPNGPLRGVYLYFFVDRILYLYSNSTASINKKFSQSRFLQTKPEFWFCFESLCLHMQSQNSFQCLFNLGGCSYVKERNKKKSHLPVFYSSMHHTILSF